MLTIVSPDPNVEPIILDTQETYYLNEYYDIDDRRLPGRLCCHIIYDYCGLPKRFSKAIESIIAKDHTWALYYAERIIKDRWPEAEPTIMKDPQRAYEYACYLIKGRWIEAESYIMREAKWAYHYAICILKERWLEAESHIMQDGYWAHRYKLSFRF